MECNCTTIGTGLKECAEFAPSFSWSTPETLNKELIRRSQIEQLASEELKRTRVLKYLNSKGFRILNFH